MAATLTSTPLCEKKQSYSIVCKKQHAKHHMETLCEKKKQHRSSMMSLLRQLEAILWKSFLGSWTH